MGAGGFNTLGLSTAYSPGGLWPSLDISCEDATVETGNRGNYFHHVHNKLVQLKGHDRTTCRVKAVCTQIKQLRKHFLTIMSDQPQPLGLNGFKAMRNWDEEDVFGLRASLC